MPPLDGFLLALALNQPLLGRVPLRAIFYLPVIVAPIAVATIWKWMYDPFFGLFNQLLVAWHLTPLDWLGNSRIALLSIFIASVWQTVGFSMVLFLAGLQNVSQTLTNIAQEALRNSINIPPTIYLDQGTRIIVFVRRDLDFSAFYPDPVKEALQEIRRERTGQKPDGLH